VKCYLVLGDEAAALAELQARKLAIEAPPAGSISPDSDPAHASDGMAAEEGAAGLKSLVQSVKGEAERSAIATALESTNWNRKAAARLLRVSYRTLLYKIQQYRMSPPPSFVPSFAAGDRRNGQDH
jgi:DNA-binding NtrC family response regulator